MCLFPGSEVTYPWKVGTQKKPGVPYDFSFQLRAPTGILPWQISQFTENPAERLSRTGKPCRQAKLTESRVRAAALGLLMPGRALALPTFVATPYRFFLGNLPGSR